MSWNLPQLRKIPDLGGVFVDAIASKFSRFVADIHNLTLRGQKVLLDSIRCEGDEDSILDCPSVTDEECFEHLEDAGVICEGELTS